MSQAVSTMSEPTDNQYCQYTGTKIDVDILRIVRAAAALEGMRMQDWLSDVANKAASDVLGRKAIKRKPIKPREPEES